MTLIDAIATAKRVDGCGMFAVVTHCPEFDSYNFHFEKEPVPDGTVFTYKYDPPAIAVTTIFSKGVPP